MENQATGYLPKGKSTICSLFTPGRSVISSQIGVGITTKACYKAEGEFTNLKFLAGQWKSILG